MKNIDLEAISTRAPKEFDKSVTKRQRILLAEQIAQLQHKIYAHGKDSVLIVLQGMDASGKDGVTKKVFADCSPTGTWAFAFKKPTDEEMEHDFLWRVHKRCPRKGMVQIFNRSHYEDVLIQRVHKWIDEETVDFRIEAINNFEKLLQRESKTLILKFYLHLSPERQREKLQERIDNPSKRWKHNPNDWKEAEKWSEYRDAYHNVLAKSEIPWFIVPADQRWYRDYFVAKTVHEELAKLTANY